MSRKRSRSKKGGKHQMVYDWRLHNTYDEGCSSNRVLTRSQVCFNQLKNTESDLHLFANPKKYEPVGMPHVIVAMKGKWGAIPNTTVTRSAGKKVYEVNEELCQRLERYKKHRVSHSKEQLVTRAGKKKSKSKKKR